MDEHDLVERHQPEREQQQEPPPGQYESNEHLNTTRILKPPATVTKAPQPASRYTSYIAQNKFKIINPSASSNVSAAGSTSTTLLRPLHRLAPQQHQQANISYHYPLTSQTLASSSSKINNNNNIISQPNDLIGDARGLSQQRPQPSRIASSRPATGLARPTPVRQLQPTAANNATTNHLTYARLPTSGGGSKIAAVARVGLTNGGSLSQLRPPTTPSAGLRAPSPATSISKLAQSSSRPRTSTLVRPKSSLVQSSTVERPKPSPRVRFGETSVGPEIRFRPASSSSAGSPSPAVSSTTTHEAVSSNGNNNNNLIDLSSVEKDVGQIRRLLEQLLVLLQDSTNDTASSSQESYRERERESSQPPVDASTRNEAFSINNDRQRESHEPGESGASERPMLSATDEDDDENRPSVYLSPMV